MMISPESFYEEYIKGKSEKQIISTIRGLKNRIGHLKNTIEHPEYVCTMRPSEKTQLWCNRLYLERSILALEKIGGTYKPSKAELYAAEFDKNIPHICELVFSIGGYFSGYETRTYFLDKEHLRMNINHTLITKPSNLNIEADYPLTKQELLDGILNLHIGEWRKSYMPERFGYTVLDGTQWELEIHYSNGHKPVKFYGSNSYPYNFDDLTELLGVEADVEDDEPTN